MRSKPGGEPRPIDSITPEDMELIKAMVELPKESKVLARGVILGLGLAGQVSPVDGLLVDPMQPSA